MIRAELSSDNYATALGVTVRSPSPVLALCKKLIEVSTYAPETPLKRLPRQNAMLAGVRYR